MTNKVLYEHQALLKDAIKGKKLDAVFINESPYDIKDFIYRGYYLYEILQHLYHSKGQLDSVDKKYVVDFTGKKLKSKNLKDVCDGLQICQFLDLKCNINEILMLSKNFVFETSNTKISLTNDLIGTLLKLDCTDQKFKNFIILCSKWFRETYTNEINGPELVLKEKIDKAINVLGLQNST